MHVLQFIPERYLDVLIRVPFLFIIDSILNSELSSVVGTSHTESNINNSSYQLAGNATTKPSNQYEHYKLCLLKDIGGDALTMLERFFERSVNVNDCPPQTMLIFLFFAMPLLSFLFKFVVIGLASIAAVLSSNYLIGACSNLVSVLMVYYSYRSSGEFVRTVAASRQPEPEVAQQQHHLPGDSFGGLALMLYCASQLLTALLLSRCLLAEPDRRQRSLRLVLFGSLQLPLALTYAGAPAGLVHRSPLLSICPAACLLNVRLLENSEPLIGQAVRAVRDLCRQARTLGIEGTLEQHWTRLRVPRLLRVFWTLKASYHLAAALLAGQPAAAALEAAALDHGCENALSLLGLTAMISWLSQLIAMRFARFISLQDYEEWQYGTVSAVLFLLLALQSGITGLSAAERISRLYHNLYAMVSAILHFVHYMCKQVMQRISSAPSACPMSLHVRALSLSLFLLLCPPVFLYVLWTRCERGAWMLALTVFCGEVVFKVLITLLLYVVSMLEARREGTFADIDDTLYCIRGVGNFIEFLFGIVLFVNGGYILVESGGIIRGFMLAFHAYYGIWQQSVDGLQALRNRWLSESRLNSLPLATEETLKEKSDVCAICFGELPQSSCRHLPCGHLFHTACIRRWIAVSVECPMCHRTMFA